MRLLIIPFLFLAFAFQANAQVKAEAKATVKTRVYYEGASVKFNTAGVSASLDLNKPNGGEVFNAGDAITIEWESLLLDSIGIAISIDGGTNFNTFKGIDSPDGTNSWNWTNTDGFNSDNCLIKVYDAGNPDLQDVSESTFTITSTSSVESKESNAFKVFPNPARGHIFFEIKETFEDRIIVEIYEPSGKSVYTGSLNNGMNRIDTENISNGSYYYIISSSGEQLEQGQIVVSK